MKMIDLLYILSGGAFLSVALLIGGNSAARSEWSDKQIVDAIYQAEGGKRAKYPYGIKSVKCSTPAECRQICFTTVGRNRKRFADYGHRSSPDFIAFLGKRYCPVESAGLNNSKNKFWIKNVRFFLAKGV